MNTVKFIDYKKTPGEKHLGIATVSINDFIHLRYKISAGKNGGYFPNVASYKISEYGQDSYLSAWVIDSNILVEQIVNCIKSNVHKYMSTSQGQSVFSAQAEIPAGQLSHVEPARETALASLGNDEIPF